MPDSQDTAKQFSANIDKAQEEIYSILFPMFPATPENLAQIQPRRTATKRYKPNEEIPPILEFDITPNRPLVLNTLRLWRLAKYHLYFTNTPNITINTTHLDFGYDIQNERYERKTLGKFTFRGCAFKEIHTMGLCDFEELHFYDCVFKGKVDFKDCHFQKLEFQNCMFESSITFDRAIFKNKAFFIHSTFKDSASFRRSQYMQRANFSQSIFMQKIDCTEVRFQDFANFTHTTFKDYADFSQCEFEKTANFYGAKFEKVPNFSQVQFKGSLNAVNMDLDFGFTNLKECIIGEFKKYNNIAPQKQGCFQKIKQRISAKLKKEQANDKKPTITKPLTHFANDFRDSFRIFKNALIKDNNNLDASEFHKLELYCKEIELGESPNKRGIQAQSEEDVRKNTKPFKEFIDYWLLRFYRNLSEHHTDFLKVFNNLILLVAMYAIFLYICCFHDTQTATSVDTLGSAEDYNLCMMVFYAVILTAFLLYALFSAIYFIYQALKDWLCSILTKLLILMLASAFYIAFIIPYIPSTFDTVSVLKNSMLFYLFFGLYFLLIFLDSFVLRVIFIVPAYIITSIALGHNIVILNPLIRKLTDKAINTDDPTFKILTLAYTILTLLVLFSLQKTARKNSIVPS